jgi:hypothetical protein
MGCPVSLGLRPEAVLTQSTRLRCSRSGNASSRCLSRLGSKLATARPITSSSITLSACQKPFHGKSWRQMPLMLFGKVAMTLPSHSMKFTTLSKEKRSISPSAWYPNCATEQLHGPAQLSLKGCLPLLARLFHRGASLDRTVSSLISPLPSRALQKFILAIADRVCCLWIYKATKKDCLARQF